MPDSIYTYTSLAAAEQALQDAISDATGDNPEVGEDDIAHDMVASIALGCDPETALELCRTQIGWLPHDVQRMRPDVVALSKSKRNLLDW